MIGMVFIFMGVVTALAVFAILSKICAGEPKRAEKREKGEIIKQLLARSERENSNSAIGSLPAGSLRLGSTFATRIDTLRECTYQEHNSKRRYSPMSPQKKAPIPLRPNLTDAEIEAQIRQCAYELYHGRGGVDGNAADDWLQAKEEVLSHKAKAATTSS